MERINLLAPEVRDNPYPVYAEMQRSAPVCQVDPGGMWAVSRFDDVSFVLKETGLFSSAGFRAVAVHPGLDHNPIIDSVILMDPPQHTKTRALVNQAFGASVIPRVARIARGVAEEAAGVLREGNVVDLGEILTTPMPSRVIANLLGLDASLGGRVKRWAEDVLSVNPAAPVEVIERVRETINTLEGYLREVIAARRRAPEDDLISDLIAAQIDGAALSDEDIVSNLFLLLTAGFETTSHLITNAVRLLARHPDVHDRVRASPALIPAFIDEVLRLEGPVQALLRLATADVKVGEGSIAAGSLVVALLGAANRDPRVFADPDRLDLDRPKSRLLSFGYGAHFCVGAALGRAEAQMALEALLALPGHFEEPPGQNDWTMSITNRGLRSYQVRLAG